MQVPPLHTAINKPLSYPTPHADSSITTADAKVALIGEENHLPLMPVQV